MKISKESIHRMAVFRALQLGDLLCSIPAIRALRHAFPQAEITLVSLPWAKMLVERFPHYFDRFISFPGYPGLPEQPVDAAAVVAFIREMQDEHFDLVLQMQGNGTIVNSLVELMGARYTAGFFKKYDYCPDPARFLEYPEGIPEIERHIKLMQHLGIPACGDHLEFPVNKSDEENIKQLMLPVGPGRFVCVHPGSRGAWRQWPPAHFALMADICTAKGFLVVLTGTKDELHLIEKVRSAMNYMAISVAGNTSLGGVAYLIKNARLLISNCTGVSHIAAAVATPSIVISMDGEPERWAPLNQQLHHTFDWTKEQDVEQVANRLRTLLEEDHVPAPAALYSA